MDNSNKISAQSACHLCLADSVEQVTEAMIPKNITSVQLPKTCKVIGDNAFRDCVNLTYVDVQSQLESIGECAFANCNSLRGLDFSQGVRQICFHAFNRCTQLQYVLLCKQSYNSSAGAQYGSIEPIEMEFDYGVFNGCKRLEWLALPDVEEMGKMVFTGCDMLDLVIVPDDMQSTEDKRSAREQIDLHCTTISNKVMQHQAKTSVCVLSHAEYQYWQEKSGIASRVYSQLELAFLYRLENIPHVKPSLNCLIEKCPNIFVQDLVSILPEYKRAILPDDFWSNYNKQTVSQEGFGQNGLFKPEVKPDFCRLRDICSCYDVLLMSENNDTNLGYQNGMQRPHKS